MPVCPNHQRQPVFNGETGCLVCWYCPACGKSEKPTGRERQFTVENYPAESMREAR